MTTPEIRQHILDLTRSLFLQPPTGQRGYRHMFQASLAVVEMWETDPTRQLTRTLAKEATTARSELAHGDRQTYATLLIDTIKSRLFDRTFFNFPFPPQGTLFAHIASADTDRFADALWDAFLSAAEASVKMWLTIYPLPKVTFTVPTQTFGSVRMIASSDTATWRSLVAKFPEIADFEPLIGHLRSDSGGYGFNTLSDVWLVAEHPGTSESARIRAAREMSILIALIFASSKKGGRFLKSGADPITRVLQIAESGSDPYPIKFGYIGELLPPLLNGLHFDAATLADIQTWFTKRTANPVKAGKASTAAAFYHHGLMADDLERFVYLFIVMDALFGVPYHVGEKIKEGTRKVFPGEPAWVDRAMKLYDLRNAIVHGDISDLDDWPHHDAYYAQFNATATTDVITLSTTSLLRFFDLS